MRKSVHESQIGMRSPPSADPRGRRALGKKPRAKEEGDLMRFYTQQPPLSCGIDLHARRLSVGLMSPAGASLRHRTLQAALTPCARLGRPLGTVWWWPLKVAAPGMGSRTCGL